VHDQTQGSGAVFVLLYRITLICGKKVKNESFGSKGHGRSGEMWKKLEISISI